MLHIKMQPQSFLGSGEEEFKCINNIIYGQGGHLAQWHGTTQTNCQYPFDRKPNVKSGENRSRGFRENI